MTKLYQEIKEEEGFRGNVYKDTLGYPTIGYGTKLPLSKDEAELLLNKRLNDIYRELKNKLDFEVKKEVEDILLHMAYQLGVNGVMKFKRMLEALKEEDYKKASIEMLDSKWATQTPSRARRLSKMMEGIQKMEK